MSKIIYQIILLGKEKSPLLIKVRQHLEVELSNMQLSKQAFSLFTVENMNKCRFGVFPTVALCFTGVDGIDCTEQLSVLRSKMITIIPIVDSFDNASRLLPELIKEVNAACIANVDDLPAIKHLVSLVLSNLGLLTKERNVFISYKRSDCQDIANQLYSRLLLAGYNVFLDTESLSAGVNFQSALKHRLADSFVFLLLNSAHFFDESSKWTWEEYKTAQQLQLGICSVMFPDVSQKREYNFNDFYYISADDFDDNHKSLLSKSAIEGLVEHVAALYARLYESRRQAVVNAFISMLNKYSVSYIIQNDGTIDITSSKYQCIVVPLIGIPKSWHYYMSDIKHKSKKGVPVYILYNNQYILEEWLQHLNWIEGKSGINPININDCQLWIKQNL